MLSNALSLIQKLKSFPYHTKLGQNRTLQSLCLRALNLWLDLLQPQVGVLVKVQLARHLEVLGRLLPMAQQLVGTPPPLVAGGGVGVQLDGLVAVLDGSIGTFQLQEDTGKGREWSDHYAGLDLHAHFC